MGVLLFLLALAASAQEISSNWLMRPWQSDDGLPDNSVDGLLQAADGYLWIGTPSGLARFDGLRFEDISITNVVAPPNRGIITMIRGSNGGLWLAMDRGGVVRLNGKNSRAFIQGLPASIPNGLAEDGEGSVWIAYRGGAVYRIKDNQVMALTAQEGLPDGPDICALATDTQGRLWFAKAGELGVFGGGALQRLHHFEPQPMRLCASRDGGMWLCSGFQLYKSDENGALRGFGEFQPANSGTVATVMLEDRNGAVWIGTSFSGLYHHDENGFSPVPASHSGILSLAEDSGGNIWVGTFGGGLDRIRPRAITLEGTESGLPFAAIQSICEAGDGSIWAATQNGVLVHHINGKWNAVPESSDWLGDATCVASDGKETVWVGSRHGVYCWRDGQFVNWGRPAELQDKTFHTLLVSRSGDLWAGQETNSAVLRVRNGNVETFAAPADSRIIRAMVEDTAGNIWVGTSKGTLLRIADDQMTEVTPRRDRELASIRCLAASQDGSLWIGYAGWGLGCLKDGRYTEFSLEQGLYDNYISHIVADNRGWAWFGANRGIFKVRQQDFRNVAEGLDSRVRPVHYGRGEGLPSLQGTFGDAPDVLRSHDGRLWIPMQTALVVVDPAKLYQKAEPPPTFLARVTVDDHVVAQYNGIVPREGGQQSLPDLASSDIKLHIAPGHRRIEIELGALSFNAPENVQFRYRLKNFDEGWIDAGTKRFATYSPLPPPGDYVFEMTACDSDGDWNKVGSSLALVIEPFFWQTWLFRVAVLLVFTASVAGVVRYVSTRRLHRQLQILEQQAALQRERARIAKDIHDDLGASLTQIAYLGELAQLDRAEPDKAAERIGKISATARQAVRSLDEIVWAVNPRNDTLAHLIDYAGQFALDYLRVAGIRCRLDFPEQIPARELSTDLRHNIFLVVKEALNNIVKHAGATEVWMRSDINETALNIIVEDNGRGFAQAPDDALADGLRNMRNRMTEIGGDCQIEGRPGSGTKVTVRMPWPDAQEK